MKIIIFASLLAFAAAAPGFYAPEDSNLIHTEPQTAKSTITKSNQVVDHGSTYIHAPIVHEVHSSVHSVVPVIHSVPVVHSKTTISETNQVVNHGGTALVHAPTHYIQEYRAPSKTTVTKSSQVVNHGGTAVVHAPVHVPVHYVEEYAPIKTTVTKSNQVVHHGGETIVHAAVHTPVLLKTGDSAVTHHSSTVHETKTSPVYTYHY